MQVTIIYKAKQKMAGSCLPHPTIINSNSRLNVPDIRTFTERCVSVWRWSLCSLRVAEPSSPLEGFELGALQFFLLLCTRLLLDLLIIFNMKSVYDGGHHFWGAKEGLQVCCVYRYQTTTYQ